MTRGTLAPVPRPKGKRKLTQAQVDELEAFVRLSRKNRQLSYLELVYEFRFWNAGVCAITMIYHQARYAANAAHLSPKKSSGRPFVLSSEQVDEIEAFVISSPEHRQLTCFQLAYAHFSHFGVSEKVIQRAMSRRGDARRIAASKPPLSAENKRKRLEFAT
ncbi:hypothetical protein K3495_g9836 [Podosphaera aphanis]|nr:hypothetical protein K3495_g9836 [Podosphaera aphanis]